MACEHRDYNEELDGYSCNECGDSLEYRAHEACNGAGCKGCYHEGLILQTKPTPRNKPMSYPNRLKDIDTISNLIQGIPESNLKDELAYMIHQIIEMEATPSNEFYEKLAGFKIISKS